MTQEMDISVFSGVLQKKAQEFSNYWHRQHEKAENKAQWPLQLPEEEWWDQFMTWLGLEGQSL